MKLTIVLLFITSSIACADEGLFPPTASLVSKSQLQSLKSVVSIGMGSGVITTSNLILTAGHVVGSCACPEKGQVTPCHAHFRAPDTIDTNGNVLTWKEGIADSLVACGSNARISGFDLTDIILSGMSPTSVPQDIEQGLFYPKEDVVALTFDNSKLRIPGISLRAGSLANGEKLYIAGFPGLGIRSRASRDIRLKALQEARDIDTEILGYFDQDDFHIAVSQVESAIATYNKKYSDLADAAPVSSAERTAIQSGPLDVLAHDLNNILIWKKRSLQKTCMNWKLAEDDCYRTFYNLMFKGDISALDIAILHVKSEDSLQYPEPDQTLRISFGHFNRYQESRTDGFLGQILTTVDVVSGNSGGPIFDENNALVGIIARGPSPSSLTYFEALGADGCSGMALEDLLARAVTK